MIVVRAMPVVNAKARTKTTKIVFMTLALCSDRTTMPEQGKRSVIAVTEQTFSQPSGARIGDRPAKSLYSWIFAGAPVRPLRTTFRRRATAKSSHARSCSPDRPARWSSPTAAVLAASACRPTGLAPDRFLKRRVSPSAEWHRPRADRTQSRAATIAPSSHRRPHRLASKTIARAKCASNLRGRPPQ